MLVFHALIGGLLCAVLTAVQLCLLSAGPLPVAVVLRSLFSASSPITHPTDDCGCWLPPACCHLLRCCVMLWCFVLLCVADSQRCCLVPAAIAFLADLADRCALLLLHQS